MHPQTLWFRQHGKAHKLAVLFVYGFVHATGLVMPSVAVAQGPKAANMKQAELAKRKAMVLEARELVAKGDQAMQQQRPDLAVEAYASARELLPIAPILDEMREAVTERYVVAAMSQAAVFANGGDLVAGRAILDRVLEQGVAPEHRLALKMRKMLNDPVRSNPAQSPEHHADVQEVLRLIQLANGAVALGRFDFANECYENILKIDPHNNLARRGMVQIIRFKEESRMAAYDKTRAEMLMDVAKEWELQVPEDNEDARILLQPAEVDFGEATIQAKLKQIIIPTVALDDVNLSDAIEFLRLKTASEDLITSDQSKRGVNFTMNLGSENSPLVQEIQNKRFNLRLQNVPAEEVLKYINQLTRTTYKIDSYAVNIVPAGQVSEEVFLRQYSVPSDFISALSEDIGAGGAGEVDPFAEVQPRRGLLSARLPIQELLKRKGISFSEGASVSYSAASNQLLVVNTAKNHDLIQQLIDIVKGADPVIVSVQVTMIKAEQRDLEELGFDWLLTPFDLGGEGSFLGGGTTGNTPGRSVGDFSSTLPLPGGVDATASNVITNGLRSGDRAFVANDLDNIINNPTRSSQASRVAPGILAMTGLFNDGQAQVIMRGLSQQTSIDTMARPSVVTRSGEAAQITLAREFIYPTEYDPPELQQGGGGQNFNNGGGGGAGGGNRSPAFPVVPANPTAFEMREVGISLEVLPIAGPNKTYINVTLNPEIVEFDGFVNYGSPITVPVPDALGNLSRLTLTENQILMPVFNTKRAATQMTVADGATVAFGGLLSQNIQSVEDKVPVLGEVPVFGRLFSSKSHLPVSTAIVFLVKVDLMDPTGRLYRELGNP